MSLFKKFVGGAAATALAWTHFATATTPPAPGVAMPEHVRKFVQENHVHMDTPGAWRGVAQRARDARRILEEGGQLPDGGIAAVTGDLAVPVLVFSFSDVAIPAGTVANLQKQLFTGPWPTGTLTEYYDEISYGALNMTGTVKSQCGSGEFPQFFAAPNTDTYYEGGQNGLPGKVGELIDEIATDADFCMDFGDYDNDGPDGIPNSGDDDGYVDMIAFVHPEKGGECGTSNIWSHRWTFASATGSSFITNDARAGGGFIRINDYTIQPAISCSNGLIEIGVFCHEFGHALGIPDLYDTDGSSEGLGHWDLMASGCWNSATKPAHMSIWSKAELGWVTPTLLLGPTQNVAFNQIETNPEGYKIALEDSEYFLIENRQKVGFDVNLHTAGMAIYHVDPKVSMTTNQANTKENCGIINVGGRYRVALEQADGDCDLEDDNNRGDSGDLFPGASNNTTFNDVTFPSAQPYSSNTLGACVENISPSGPVMTADICAFPLPPSTVPALDVVFIIDVSGSYGDDIVNTQTQMPAAVAAIKNNFPDSRFGLATFRDFPYNSFGGATDFAYQLNHTLTTDWNAVVTAIGGLTASGGADLPESQYEALYQAMTGKGRDLNNDGVKGNFQGEIAISDMGWISTRQPVIYLLTDASFHNSDTEQYPGAPALLEAIGRNGVKNEINNPTVLGSSPIIFTLNADYEGTTIVPAMKGDVPNPTPDTLETQAGELAQLTGGALIAAGKNTVDFYDAVRASLEILIPTFPEVGSCCTDSGATCTDGIQRQDCESILSGAFNGGGSKCSEGCDPPKVMTAIPPSGTLDARQPHSPSTPKPRQGIGSPDEPILATLGFDGETADDFDLCETMVDPLMGPNSVLFVDDLGDGSYKIWLSHAITAGGVTRLYHKGTEAYVLYTAHPANPGSDAVASPADILFIIDMLNGVKAAPHGNYSRDINRDGKFNPPDVLRLVDLLNGAGAYDVWNGTAKPEVGICKP